MVNENITCIIQARLSSSRLPGKILMHGYDKPLLLHLLERIKKSKFIKKIIIATTYEKIDKPIKDICKKNKIEYFSGHPTDVLSRYYNCAKKNKIKNILRITSDCPLIDYKIIDEVIKKFFSSDFDYVSNIHPASAPDGFDVEIFKFSALKKAFFKAKKKHEREHVTPYIWDNEYKFKKANVLFHPKKKLHDRYRLTLDYLDDYFLIWNIYNFLYPKKKYFSLNDILKFLRKNKNMITNKKLIKVNWYRNSLSKLKTINKNDTNLKAKV
tara:strand:- start:74 stop:880 length:807 start_codon:yes stop_codon:yes gene_type:complete